jgi:hypothetical protein
MRLFIIIILILTNQLGCFASSHQESSFVALNPAIDATDLYAFTSYENEKSGYITIIANYQGLQDSFAGPNYFLPDSSALYEIKIDNDGDAVEDLTFRFRFKQKLVNENQGLTMTVGDQEISIPFINSGAFFALDRSKLNRDLSYSIELIRSKPSYDYGNTFNKIRDGVILENFAEVFIPEFTPPDKKTFWVPEYNIGSKSVADYNSYADNFIYSIKIPKKNKKSLCEDPARVFAGPRKNSFKANLGGIFDLVNKNLESAENSAVDEFSDKNVFSIALEIPKACLDLPENQSVIGVWTTANLPARRILKNHPIFSKASFNSTKDFVQVSRLGNPFVNQMLIGFKDKDLFNASRPRQDSSNLFTNYILYPALASLIQSNSTLVAPTAFPRVDLEELFLTGFSGLNKYTRSQKISADVLRLNTATAPTAKASQNRLGVLGGDNAGWPNGRRPGDDVTDIFLRYLMGANLDLSVAPEKNNPLTDGVLTNANDYLNQFPYLLAP